MAFQSIVLVFAAAHRSRLRGAMETLQATQQKSSAVSLLRARVDDVARGAEADDDTIASMLGLASFEVGATPISLTYLDLVSYMILQNQFGRKELAHMHMRAVMDLLRQRGGSAALLDYSKLSAYGSW